ncbi:unnamed protein product, partial [Prorocentrum cordatum]
RAGVPPAGAAGARGRRWPVGGVRGGGRGGGGRGGGGDGARADLARAGWRQGAQHQGARGGGVQRHAGQHVPRHPARAPVPRGEAGPLPGPEVRRLAAEAGPAPAGGAQRRAPQPAPPAAQGQGRQAAREAEGPPLWGGASGRGRPEKERSRRRKGTHVILLMSPKGRRADTILYGSCATLSRRS